VRPEAVTYKNPWFPGSLFFVDREETKGFPVISIIGQLERLGFFEAAHMDVEVEVDTGHLTRFGVLDAE